MRINCDVLQPLDVDLHPKEAFLSLLMLSQNDAPKAAYRKIFGTDDVHYLRGVAIKGANAPKICPKWWSELASSAPIKEKPCRQATEKMARTTEKIGGVEITLIPASTIIENEGGRTVLGRRMFGVFEDLLHAHKHGAFIPDMRIREAWKATGRSCDAVRGMNGRLKNLGICVKQVREGCYALQEI